MNLVTPRRLILAAAFAVTATVAPVAPVASVVQAAAIVGGQTAARLHDGIAAAQILFPGGKTALCSGMVIRKGWIPSFVQCNTGDAQAAAPARNHGTVGSVTH